MIANVRLVAMFLLIKLPFKDISVSNMKSGHGILVRDHLLVPRLLIIVLVAQKQQALGQSQRL